MEAKTLCDYVVTISMRSAVFLFILGASLHSQSAGAVPPQYVCTSPGVTPGSSCSAVQPTPWKYEAYLGYSINLPGAYATLGQIAALIPPLMISSTSWCSLTYNSTSLDVPSYWGGSSPVYIYGIDWLHQHILTYDRISHTTDPVPCTQISSYDAYILQTRDIKCPAGHTLIHETGPPVVGPYCALEWTNADENKSVGTCSAGQIEKGNPCEIGSGNKHQLERDHLGMGPFPLKFERHFNSLAAKNDYYYAAMPRWEPLGVGWTGDYLQKIDYFAYGSAATAFVYRPDGKRIAFNASGTDFVAPQDIETKLTAQRNGSGIITGWTLTTDQDGTETYTADGRLLSLSRVMQNAQNQRRW